MFVINDYSYLKDHQIFLCGKLAHAIELILMKKAGWSFHNFYA